MSHPIEQALAWSQWLQAHQTALCIIVGVILLALMGLSVKSAAGRQETHGSSRWATLREARKGGLVRRRGYPLGQLGGRELRVVNRHILLVGGTGSRKDRSHNFPFTVSCPWSLLILDVKEGGENSVHCGTARRRVGPVYRLCPGDPQSHAFNPLSAVRVGEDQEFRDVMFLANSLLAPRKKDTRASDSGAFFERRGAVVLRGILLYALHTLADATLTHCHQLMDDPASVRTAMQAHPHPEVRAQGTRLAKLQQDGARQFASEWSTAQDALDMFSDPAIAAITGRSDFALAALQFGPRPVTLYLGAESPMDLTYLYPLYRLLIESAYRMLSGTPAPKRHPLTCLLNEFNELGWMDIIERAPAHSRSAKIWFIVVVQDLGHLFGTYGYDTPLWGNLRVKIFHAPDSHDETAGRLSRMLGDQTITAWSTTESDRRSRTRHRMARKLLDLGEVMGLGPEQVLVWAGLKHPLLLAKPPYWKG